jgi:hypothetical protein
MRQHRTWLDAICNRKGRHRDKAGIALILAVIAILVIGAASGCRQADTPSSERRPKLIVDDSVAADFDALAAETWDKFLTVFQARTGCFGDVRLRAAYTLDSRAGYDPDSATVTVRVPGTPAMLQGALIHEWAHHVEFQCEEHRELRSAFLAVQGLPPDTPWRLDDTPASSSAGDWANVPSEQYAEAAIELVLGERPISTPVRVTREAISVIEEWAAGD